MRLLGRILPSRAQEIVGEVGTWFVASLLGFKNAGLVPARKPNGPDMILQHASKSLKLSGFDF
jgi:hypothetical protein